MDEDGFVMLVENEPMNKAHILITENSDWDVACCGETLPLDFIDTYLREGRREHPVLKQLCRDCVRSLARVLKD